ncbi:hypothetical protein TorRG33x02_070050 [Trema orientale]|uniref:Uncharacterized protein n=1 Tax=Trema orientale TaxID=63057 RepID=A0A2P5FHI3_TREOI|nr:hypothetical protein TorRG33x02_070050 [Trema orientale]
MASTTCEIVWLRWLHVDMGVFFSRPTPLYYNNKSVIQISHNSVFHERTKHIEIDCHIVRHYYQISTLILPFVSSTIQIADLFTKAHTTSRFRFLFNKLSMLLAAVS